RIGRLSCRSGRRLSRSCAPASSGVLTSRVSATPARWRTRRGARPGLTAGRLHGPDGQASEISRSFQNVRDPYREVGRLLRGLMPTAAGQVLPTFPTVDQVIAAYAGQPG